MRYYIIYYYICKSLVNGFQNKLSIYVKGVSGKLFYYNFHYTLLVCVVHVPFILFLHEKLRVCVTS